ncbi:hypothetical protein M2139_001835 [Enterococcus sp. PF1-24]|uniref:hypothetical protein n=1 Tax=unclassified Enterococcus TaxID=2608891 RepID=UPI0024742FA2|nr:MULTISPECIES: hypothetical protein [unclassified Enterococcus]MDH6364841.1 hypothetical protein [Enterococcus sp. PFB1-1]MDH6401935.1 hypothetical protein [Enterococcus sp. PF1-24]
MKKGSQLQWYLFLFIAIGLFSINLFIGNMLINIGIIVLAIIIYQYGSPVLFKEYNARKQKQLAESRKIREAANEVLRSGKLLKK